jgi:replicative DNA helicase
MLVFDEADYLSSKDIDAALAVIINHPDATVWMSSTPTGRREKFYSACQNKLYKEFHFSSQVNPIWDQALEDYYRSELTEDGWKHEILASWGDQEEGVYQIKYVEAAQTDYEYSDMSYDPNMVYMIGVDWNDVKIGTTIAVVGMNARTGVFYLVDKQIISRGERTQLSACEKIADMNRLWLPSNIYVDAGFGSTQQEVLHDFGQQQFLALGPQHPDGRLRNIVKEYDFGSSVEIRDLFTQQPSSKPAKPFLVENSVRRFENLNFKYPKSDTDYTAQLQGYVIKRVSAAGRPIYEARNEKVGDHFLDAVNLALVAFTLEKGKFGKATYPSASISFIGKIGEGLKDQEKKNTGDTMNKLAETHRPSMNRKNFTGRDSSLIRSNNGEMPGSHMDTNKGKLWDYPGFGRDAPKPNVRTLDEAMKEAQKRIGFGINRRSRPNRVKF